MLSPLSLLIFSIFLLRRVSSRKSLLKESGNVTIKRRQQTTIFELHCKDILGTSSAGDQCVRNLFSITIKQPNFRARVALRNHELRVRTSSQDCLNQQEAELQLLYPLQFVDTKNNWSFKELKNRDTANSRIRKCAGSNKRRELMPSP
ncbi:unnamed protein product [Rhizophagus irregularis]|nr:unnamed protein product [Rhizophagus irregularis]